PENRLAVAQLELMAGLAERPGARPGELARSLRLAPNTVTTLVNGLARTGMVTRTDDPTDRRMVRLALTSAGHDALASWAGTNELILHRAQENLTDEQRAALRAALPALTQLVAVIDAVADHDA
ncbi:MAG: MarR family transcriptional regulator, partial [Actinocatenispora sp.]